MATPVQNNGRKLFKKLVDFVRILDGAVVEHDGGLGEGQVVVVVHDGVPLLAHDTAARQFAVRKIFENVNDQFDRQGLHHKIFCVIFVKKKREFNLLLKMWLSKAEKVVYENREQNFVSFFSVVFFDKIETVF